MAGVTEITYGARREGKTFQQLADKVDRLENKSYLTLEGRIQRLEHKVDISEQAYPVDQERIEYMEKSIGLISEQQQQGANFEVEVSERLDELEKQMEALRKIVGRYAVTKQDKLDLAKMKLQQEASRKLWGVRRGRR